MEAKKVINFFSHWVNKLEPEYTLRLVDIEYSAKYGQEVCVMQLSGKNTFPKYKPQDLLSNPKAVVSLSPKDAIVITQLDQMIQERKRYSKILEIDKNGTIVLKLSSGKIQRFSEKYISSYRRDLLKSIQPEDAHDLGYRVGFKEGINIEKQKKKISRSIRKKFMSFIPALWVVKK